MLLCNAFQHNTYRTTGLGFSRPKPVFPVQNGINWEKPVFPVQNWEKLSKTGKNYISSSKKFLKCDFQTKLEQDMLEDNLTKSYELIIQILWK